MHKPPVDDVKQHEETALRCRNSGVIEHEFEAVILSRTSLRSRSLSPLRWCYFVWLVSQEQVDDEAQHMREFVERHDHADY